MLHYLLSQAQLAHRSQQDHHQLQQQEEHQCHLRVPKQDLVDVVALQEEVLVPVQLLQFLVAVEEGLVHLHLLLVPDQSA